MVSDRNRRIQDRAYEIWEAGGRQEGTADRNWEQAAREIEAAEAGKAAPKTATNGAGKRDAGKSDTGQNGAGKKTKPEAQSTSSAPPGTGGSLGSEPVAAASDKSKKAGKKAESGKKGGKGKGGGSAKPSARP